MLKRFFGSMSASEANIAASDAPKPLMTAAEEAAGLNIRTAIDAHIKWRRRLEDFVQGTSHENLQVNVVSADNNCILGKWIHGDGQAKYGHLQLFTELVSVHAKFHEHAGAVLAAAKSGRRDEALGLLQAGNYPRTSAKVKHLLAKLYVEVLCEDHPLSGHPDPNPPAVNNR